MGQNYNSGNVSATITDELNASVNLNYDNVEYLRYDGTGSDSNDVPTGKKWIIVGLSGEYYAGRSTQIVLNTVAGFNNRLLVSDISNKVYHVAALPIVAVYGDTIRIDDGDGEVAYIELDA